MKKFGKFTAVFLLCLVTIIFSPMLYASTLCYQNTIQFQNNSTHQHKIIINDITGAIRPQFSHEPYEFGTIKYPLGSLKDCIDHCEITINYSTEEHTDCIVTLFLKQQKRSCIMHITVNTYEHCNAEAFSSGGVGGGDLILQIL